MKIANFEIGSTIIIAVLAIAFFMNVNKIGGEITYQLLVIFTIILIIIEVVLIVTFIKWLYSIRAICSNLQSISQGFYDNFKDQDKVTLLQKELRELGILISKKEQYVLHTTFHVEEIEKYVRILLDELKEVTRLSKDKEQGQVGIKSTSL
ncbi:hypothetical protein [Candidatus Tisiphia endosymbiont of Oplodontha viridula]|uniref:hypothetical protein n=1 Tax=Candidatus Tisiphia endosymbiont of Oplodontha viridula TaxID=3077925 RepID=UPI0035C88B9F